MEGEICRSCIDHEPELVRRHYQALKFCYQSAEYHLVAYLHLCTFASKTQELLYREWLPIKAKPKPLVIPRKLARIHVA